MPKLKKSAWSAIRSATRHARGSSIIVPTVNGSGSAPASSIARAAASLDQRAHQLELPLVVDQRDHDLDRAAPCRVRSRTASAAPTIARTCIS